ncbi:MAG: zinc-ribbon domain-containing protein, partial [Acidobacteriota bacterium]|nr:zinc-ribbon domain-containing protein [Acidobacteriota bacterium]
TLIERELEARLKARGESHVARAAAAEAAVEADEDRAAAPAPVFCTACGVQNEGDARFCKACGHRLVA